MKGWRRMRKKFNTKAVLCLFLTAALGWSTGYAQNANSIVENNGSVSGTGEETVTVSLTEWKAVQADLTSIKTQLAEDKIKADAKKAEEEKKKYTKPNWKITGRFFLDGVSGSMNDDGEAMGRKEVVSGSEFRQIRLGLKGTLYDMIEYRFNYEFEGSRFNDVYGGFYNLPSKIDIRFGHFMEPWSIDQLSTAANTQFLERSFICDMTGLVGARNNGIMFHNWYTADRFSWAAGVFAPSQGDTSLKCVTADDHYAFTTRVTFLPWYTQCPDDSIRMLHLGAAYSFRKYDAQNFTPSAKAQAGFHPMQELVKTGNLVNLDSLNALSFEAIWIRGAFSVDFEQAFYFLDDPTAPDDPEIQTGYIQCAYTLTGESRNYSKEGGVFKFLKPKTPFIRTCKDGAGVFQGPGAWELAYRYSWIDMEDMAYNSGSLAGEAETHSVGLNWYLNDNCRMMFDYVLAHSTDVKHPGLDNWENLFGTRFQVMY